MLSVPELVRIFVCTQPTGMRKGFDSLAAVVRDWLGGGPLSRHLFVFRIADAAIASSCSGGTRTGWRFSTSGWRKASSASRRPAIPRRAASRSRPRRCRWCCGASIRRA